MEPLVAMTLCCAAGWAGDELRASAAVNMKASEIQKLVISRNVLKG